MPKGYDPCSDLPFSSPPAPSIGTRWDAPAGNLGSKPVAAPHATRCTPTTSSPRSTRSCRRSCGARPAHTPSRSDRPAARHSIAMPCRTLEQLDEVEQVGRVAREEHGEDSASRNEICCATRAPGNEMSPATLAGPSRARGRPAVGLGRPDEVRGASARGEVSAASAWGPEERAEGASEILEGSFRPASTPTVDTSAIHVGACELDQR